MIARTWHGAVAQAQGDEYYEYLLRTGIPDYKQTEGNLAVYVFRRNEEGLTHFLLLTLWSSWEAIKAFAGDDPERAHYYEEDKQYLVELETYVKHYDVLMSHSAGGEG